MTNEYRVKLEFLQESGAVFQRHMKTPFSACAKQKKTHTQKNLNESFLLLPLYLPSDIGCTSKRLIFVFVFSFSFLLLPYTLLLLMPALLE